MNEQNQRDSIMSMARGAFEERVDYEMDKVIRTSSTPTRRPRPSARSPSPSS